jgi:hypothetical protein
METIGEFARNPIVKAKVQCKPCGKKFDIEEMLREEAMPYPYTTVQEGFLLCPNCGHKTHNYYMPESLRHHQVMLKKAVLEYQRTHSKPAWTEYVRRLRVFQRNYDSAQAKYKALFAEEAANGEGNGPT